jgi:DNA primase
MEALVKYLNSDRMDDDLHIAQCPFCQTRVSSLFIKNSDNKYRCFKCGVVGDLDSLKTIMDHKYDYS